MLNWTKDKQTMEVEGQIMRRAAKMVERLGTHYPNMDIIMDVDACHSNGCPLQLQALLDAEDHDFAHDIFGIRQHINRRTGQLMNCFLPRYAACQETAKRKAWSSNPALLDCNRVNALAKAQG